MNIIINLLKNIWPYILKIIPVIYGLINKKIEADEIDDDDEPEEKPKIPGNAVLNPKAIKKSIDFLNKNQIAYYEGKQIWPRGKRGNKSYNNVLLLDRPEFTRVYRLKEGGIFHFVDYEPISKKQFDDIPQSYNTTYCNLALSVFYRFFTSDVRGELQLYGGEEFDANKVCENIYASVYNTEHCVFDECTREAGELIASQGGFVVCLWHNPNGIGHVAALIGNNKIFQAGKEFGEMSIAEGFGANNVRKIRYFYWGTKN